MLREVHTPEREPSPTQKPNSIPNGLKQTLKAVLGASLVWAAETNFNENFHNNLKAPCTKREQQILAGVDAFYRKESPRFQEEYDAIREAHPEIGLSAINFAETNLNAPDILDKTKNAEVYCSNQGWAQDLTDSIHYLSEGTTWDTRSSVSTQSIFLRNWLFKETNPCQLASGYFHEKMHLAGVEHEGEMSPEEAKQNPLFAYEQTGEAICRQRDMHFQDFLDLGAK